MCCLECDGDYDIVYHTDYTVWAHPYLCPECAGDGRMPRVINLTQHDVNLYVKIGTDDAAAIVAIPPAGMVARCSVRREKVGEVGGIPVNRAGFGDVEGLPDPQPDTYYIVSALVAQACPDRHDLLLPDDTIRDDQGRIIGCRALATVAREWEVETMKLVPNSFIRHPLPASPADDGRVLGWTLVIDPEGIDLDGLKPVTHIELRPDVEVISTAYGGVFGQVLVAWDAGKPCPFVARME
jgi:hypothetical protein